MRVNEYESTDNDNIREFKLSLRSALPMVTEELLACSKAVEFGVWAAADWM